MIWPSSGHQVKTHPLLSTSNDQGVRSGSAYVHVRDPATGAWSEQQKLLASDGAAGDFFGGAVSLSGNTAIVGATGNVSSYVFVRDTATGIWTEQQKLVATGVIAAGFGTAVFVEGDMAIVGASGEDTPIIDSGAAYIFVRDGTDTWNLEQKLLASDAGRGDALGVSVSLNGDTAIVGAFLDAQGWGSAYIFVRDFNTGTWTEQQKLLASDTGVGHFGRSVALNGDTAIVGADRAGAAYVYARDTNTGTWTENQKMRASVVAGGYGLSMSISGNALVIGAHETAGKGAAFIYTSAVPTYTVGGNVTGLAGSGLVLQNNGGDDLDIAADGSFVFATALDDLSLYAVTVLTQPTSPNQTCTVSNGSGAIAAANVTDVVVTCVDDGTFTFSNVSYTAGSVTFTIDGDMSGYAAGNVLNGFSLVYAGDIMMPAMTAGNFWSRSVFDNKTISESGATDDFVAGDYTWSKYVNPLQDASVNNATVTVTLSHPHLNESAVSPSISFVWGIGPGGTVLATVTPTVGGPPPATFSVGGTVSGLTGTGLALQNNGGDTFAVAAAVTAFTFVTELPDLATYAVTVSTQPTDQTCSVTGGDNNLGGGAIAGANVTSVIVTCVTNKADQTITGFTATPSSGAVGGSSTLSATASSGLAVTFGSTTPAICTVAGSTVSYLLVGTCTVTADQAGDVTYNPALQVTLDIGVGLTDQVITNFVATPSTGVVNGSSTLSATGGASSNLVVFGSNTLAVCTVAGSTVTYVTAGTCTVTADQAGNDSYNAAPTVTLDITVAKADQTITGLAANPATGVVEASSVLSATASSGLTVSFGSSTPTVCTVAGTTVSYLAAGTCTVTADQAGDATYNAATQVTLDISVAKADQTISGLNADPASGLIGGTSTLSVSSAALVARIAQSGQTPPTTKASGIPVTFGSNTLTICTVAGTTVSYLAIGTCTVTADQAGDADYNPAPQLTLDINVIEVAPLPAPAMPIPTLSLWGLVAMFLMMLGIGGMIVRRRTRG